MPMAGCSTKSDVTKQPSTCALCTAYGLSDMTAQVKSTFN